jgi:thiamine-phosphate pyrophosphorylase
VVVRRLPRLYAILDVEVASRHGWPPAALARAFLDGGARLIQVRDKRGASGATLALCDEVVAIARAYDALVIVNDRADLARLAGAAGVHVGQDDLPVRAARALVGPAALVGLSTHTPAQVAAGVDEPASYLAVGPVFGTATKETGYLPVGLDLVRTAARLAGDTPIVAIGGITLDRAPEVLAAGAQAVAVISDLLATGDPAGRVRAYVERLEAL